MLASVTRQSAEIAERVSRIAAIREAIRDRLERSKSQAAFVAQLLEDSQVELTGDERGKLNEYLRAVQGMRSSLRRAKHGLPDG